MHISQEQILHIKKNYKIIIKTEKHIFRMYITHNPGDMQFIIFFHFYKLFCNTHFKCVVVTYIFKYILK